MKRTKHFPFFLTLTLLFYCSGLMATTNRLCVSKHSRQAASPCYGHIINIKGCCYPNVV